MKKLLSIALAIVPWLAGAATPFEFRGVYQDGTPVTNTITIAPWPATNYIIAVGTNMVLYQSQNFTPDTNGYVSGSLMAGNYKLTAAGLSYGMTFGIVDTNTTQNLAQVSGVPVVTFMNFTIAQFTDAGSAAYSNHSVFASNSPTGIKAALQYTPATNSNAGIVGALLYTPLTNTALAVTNAIGYVPATNSTAGITTALGYTPLTNTALAVTNAIGYVPATNSTAGIVAALGYTPLTNTALAVTNAIGYVPATNSAAGITSALGYTPLSHNTTGYATNYGLLWIVTNLASGVTPNATAPDGSILTGTNGAFYVRSNSAWVLK